MADDVFTCEICRLSIFIAICRTNFLSENDLEYHNNSIKISEIESHLSSYKNVKNTRKHSRKRRSFMLFFLLFIRDLDSSLALQELSAVRIRVRVRIGLSIHKQRDMN